MSRQDLEAAVAAAAATLLGAVALRPVFAGGRWFPPVLAAVLVVLVSGILLRAAAPSLWRRLGNGRPVPERLAGLGLLAVPIGQLVALACLFCALYAPSSSLLGVVPTAAGLEEVGRVLADGVAEMREQAPPALPLTGLVALTALLVALVAVVVDLIAVAGRQPAAAGLGLLVLYCVPVGTITGSIGLAAVAAPAAGLALLLWTDQHGRLAGRLRTARTTGLRPATGTVAAFRTGVSALAVGLVAGAVVPTLTEGSLSTGLGGGTGGSTGTSLDPVAELRGQLTRPEPIDLLRVATSVEDPGYLRAVALDQYDGEAGWTMSNLAGEISIAEEDQLAAPVAAPTSRRVEARIEALEHDDRFLPVPIFPSSVQMLDGSDDSWRFDPATGTIYGRDVTTTGTSYAVEALEPRPAVDVLRGVADLPLDDELASRFTALPPLDASVTDLVVSLTAGADGPYERVRAILDHLTDRANGFIYSLSTAPGTSGDDLVDFLRLKRGYCEQYAGAMAVLVRAAGVPARVALGYTPGTQRSDGSRVITSDDAHAWVEVWFDGLGWVPFDPTPIGIDRSVDLPWAPRVGAATETPTEPGVPEPTAAPQPAAPRVDRAGEPVPTAPTGGADSGPWGTVALVAGLAVLLVALGAAPAVARGWQRRRRIADGRAGALWDELSATALDLGLRRDRSWTPRVVARELAGVVPATGTERGGDVRDAVERLARAEEAASYGPAGRDVVDPGLAAALRTARRGLLATAPLPVRLRAVFWPTSMWTAARTGLAGLRHHRPALPGSRRSARRRGVERRPA